MLISCCVSTPPPPSLPQVVGDSEEINGYIGLAVHVWIALRSGHCW